MVDDEERMVDDEERMVDDEVQDDQVHADQEPKLIEFDYKNLFKCMTKIYKIFTKYNDLDFIKVEYNKLLNMMFNLLKHDWNKEETINIREGDKELFKIEDSIPKLIDNRGVAENRGIYRGYKESDLNNIKTKKNNEITEGVKNAVIESCFVTCLKQKCLVFGDIHGDIFPIIEVLKNNVNTIDDLTNCEIIFLGDIYDPFNNEFIININGNNIKLDAAGDDTSYDVSGNNLFNKKLQYFATNDMYLSIIFIMFLAYKGAKVYWILGNHDINSCALNPFFYALMRLIKNNNINDDLNVDDFNINDLNVKDFDENDMDEDDMDEDDMDEDDMDEDNMDGYKLVKIYNTKIKTMIRTIQENLFICEKMFYKYKYEFDHREILQKIFFTHEPKKVYQLGNNLFGNDENGNELDNCINRINKEFNLGLGEPDANLGLGEPDANLGLDKPDANLYYMTFTSDIDGGNDNCRRTSFSTYNTAIVDNNTGTSISNILGLGKGEKLDIKKFWDLWVSGHTYGYHTDFFTLFDNSIIENKKEVIIKEGEISLDHTTSLYKSTVDVCSGTMSLRVIKTNELGYYKSRNNDPMFIKLKNFIETKNLSRDDQFIINNNRGNVEIRRNTGNLFVRFADLLFILDEIFYNHKDIKIILGYLGEFNFNDNQLAIHMREFIEKIKLFNIIYQPVQQAVDQTAQTIKGITQPKQPKQPAQLAQLEQLEQAIQLVQPVQQAVQQAAQQAVQQAVRDVRKAAQQAVQHAKLEVQKVEATEQSARRIPKHPTQQAVQKAIEEAMKKAKTQAINKAVEPIIDDLKTYVNVNYDEIRKEIFDKSGDKPKILDIRLVYLTIKISTTINSENDYKYIRNQIFLKNKHRLINGSNPTGSCGYIYYGILDKSNFTLENIDLTDCYKKKYECIKSLISIKKSNLELIKIIKNKNLNNLVGGHQPGAKRNETNLTMNKKSFNHYKKTSKYNKPGHKSFDTKQDAIERSIIQSRKINKPKLNLNDLNEVYEYIMKNPFIVKKLYERFYYEGFYHMISNSNLKKINGYYITNYLYKFVYNGNTLKDYDTTNNIDYTIETQCKNIDKFLKLLNPIENELPDNYVLQKTFSYVDAIKFICKHSNDYPWEIDYFITKINKDSSNTKFKLEIENSYINDEILRIAEFFINNLYCYFSYHYNNYYYLKGVLMRFVELSLKHFQTIQEMNMIINYIRHYLYENNILIDRRFALHIFYYVLQNLKVIF